jgi:glycosyltransferase involved in cell wall biosynthesis
MPRLLILCEYPTLLGGERSMLATLPAVAAAGFEIAVAGPPCGLLSEALHGRGIPKFGWQTTDATGARLSLGDLRGGVATIVSKYRPDLLHANSLSTARIAGPVAAESGLHSIGHLRDILKLTSQAINDLNRHTRLVAVSHATRDFHVAQGLDAAKCVVLHNGVDLTRFRPQKFVGYLHRQLGLPMNAQLIAVIGQLGLRKGTDVALAAALRVAERQSGVHWLVVGERTSNKPESRDFESSLHEIASQKPLVGHVHFLGSRSDVEQWLHECTLVVHAARQEPLGRVLLEAAAAGVAVVATDVGGTREIFPTEQNGAILVPPDDPAGLAAAVQSLLFDDARRQTIGAGGRQRTEAAFDICAAARGLIEQYQIALE